LRIGVNMLPLFPGQIGGMEAYARNVMAHLPAIDRHHRYYVFVAPYNRHLFDLAQPNVSSIQTFSLQGFRYATRGLPWLAGWVARRFPRLARTMGNALASAAMLYGMRRHGIDVWFCPLINLAPRHVRLPSVVSIPDLQPEFFPAFFRKDLLEWSRRRYPASCRDATSVITFSEFSRSTIVDRYQVAREKIAVIPLAASPDFLRPRDASAIDALKATYGLPPEYAFYPANTWRHKNHVALVQALHLLREKRGRVLSCVLTGVEREGHAALVEATQARGLAGQIHILGYVPPHEMPMLYAGARFLVFPSLFEGFGLPVLEAMASGCPVACSNVASLPEVAGDAALYFDPHDPEAIADAMDQLLTDDDLRQGLVRAGAARVRQFSWERTARETLKVLEEAGIPAGRHTTRGS